MSTALRTSAGSATSPTRRRRNVAVVAVLILAVLIVAELAVRAIEPRLQAPNLWPEAIAGAKARQIEHARDDGATADIVVVGSSVALDGVDPEALAAGLGTDATIYNAAIPLAQFGALGRWTLDIVTPSLEPSLVVVAVTSRAFDQIDEGEEYEDWLVASTGYRELGSLDKSIAFRIDRTLSDWFALFRARTALRDFNQTFAALLGRELDPGYEMSEYGHRRQFDIAYRVPREWSPKTSPLLEFEMQGRASLQSFVAGLRERGVGVVFVNMPVTEDYVSLHGATEYEGYIGELERWAAESGAHFIDLSDSVPNGHYWDPAHLTPTGALAVSERLGEAMKSLGLGA